MSPMQYIVALISAMHGAIAMRMLPATGESNMSDERVKALISDTFRMIREAHATVLAASQESDEVKAKREKAHKEAATKFAALLESALSQKTPPAWAVAYNAMATTAKPEGGDKNLANEIQKAHDDQRKLVVEAFAITNPFLAGADEWIPRLGTKGRPAGSRNKPKDEVAETPAAETPSAK